MPSDTRDPETHDLLRGESALVYCADFSAEPTVAAGESMSAPSVSITNGPTLVTLGTPLVLTSDFTEYDKNGNVGETVDSGKGVKFAVTPLTTKGQCTVTVTAVMSGGSTVGQQLIFRVR